MNLDHALIEAHQVFNGPVFGERLDEVQEYIANRKRQMHHRILYM